MAKFAGQVGGLLVICFGMLTHSPVRADHVPPFFEGCGTLVSDPVNCLVFVPDGEEFNLLRIGGWEPFGENDRIFVSGMLDEDCASICFSHACLSEKSIIEACEAPPPGPPGEPAVPTLSEWGAVILALLFLVAATMAIRRRLIRPHSPACLISLLLLIAMVRGAQAQPEDVRRKLSDMLSYPHHPHHLLVRFEPEATEAERLAAHLDAEGVERKRYVLDEDLVVVSIADGDLEQALVSYLTSGHVVRAEPDYRIWAVDTPDDEYFCAQWALQNDGGNVLACIGESQNGTAGADIRATYAWDLWTGAPGFRVAVVDTGVDYTHPDLLANIWVNLGEIPGNGIDDDLNGYVDDVHGYNFMALSQNLWVDF